ncbi:hypothetical protein [Massilia sp. LjRoot122]|uniref:hypothetical protein n=1 Tax=Massilia sp. LjRoot122 TaxID=3342257 RepID=UPI003ED07933
MTLGTIITGVTAMTLAGIIVHLWMNLKRPKWAITAAITFPMAWWISGNLLS